MMITPRRNAYEADGDKRILPNDDLETYMAFPDAGIKVRWVRRGRQVAGPLIGHAGACVQRDYLFGTDIGQIVLRSDIGYDSFMLIMIKDKKGTDVDFEEVFKESDLEAKLGFHLAADWCGRPWVNKKSIRLSDQTYGTLYLALERIRKAVWSAVYQNQEEQSGS